jgi:acyl-CoA reductase-like NAD-dependent aldehyde dehydrogenase
MRVFQEEIFGPVVALTTLVLLKKPLKLQMIPFGLGAGVWSRCSRTIFKYQKQFKPVETNTILILLTHRLVELKVRIWS